MRLKKLVLLGATLLAAISAGGTPVSPATAKRAAQNWVKLSPRPLGENVGQTAANVVSGIDTNGAALFHVVRMQEGGFVVTSADDDVDPIVAFSENGDGGSATNQASPLYAWLQHDMRLRSSLSKKITYSAKGNTNTVSRTV